MLWRLGAGLPREPGFSHRPALVKCMVEQMTLEEVYLRVLQVYLRILQVYLRVLQVSPVCIFPPMVHAHLCISNANIILRINDYK